MGPGWHGGAAGAAADGGIDGSGGALCGIGGSGPTPSAGRYGFPPGGRLAGFPEVWDLAGAFALASVGEADMPGRCASVHTVAHAMAGICGSSCEALRSSVDSAAKAFGQAELDEMCKQWQAAAVAAFDQNSYEMAAALANAPSVVAGETPLRSRRAAYLRSRRSLVSQHSPRGLAGPDQRVQRKSAACQLRPMSGAARSMMEDGDGDFLSPAGAPGEHDNTETPPASPGAKARRDKEMAARFLDPYRAPTGDVLPTLLAFGEQGSSSGPPHAEQFAMGRQPTRAADILGPPLIGSLSTPPTQPGTSGVVAPQLPAPLAVSSQPASLPAQPPAPRTGAKDR